jgi:DNA-binding NtrC family response regulator
MNASETRILVVDDDQSFRRTTAELLRDDGHTVHVAADGREAGQKLEEGPYDLVLMDLRMPGLDGTRVVEVLRRRGVRTPVLMVSGYGTVASAVESLHVGADDFLVKPVDPEALSRKVHEILQRRPSENAVRGARFAGMVGRSSGMRAVFDAIEKVASTETTILVTGETGTGKELVARAIHEHSARAGGPLLPVNCAALAEGLLESELFGHLRGAFTGAHADKEGLFRAADGGTILLDEVGDMGLRLQQRLLRVLQEGEVMPVGGHRPIPVDVRVVAATHRDLEAEVRAQRFRKDLFYRLDVFRITLPPLRDRGGDIPLLVEEALRRLRERSARPAPAGCSPLAMRLLRAYGWPGNVRELFSAIEFAAIQAGDGRIEAQHLPDAIRRAQEDPGASEGSDAGGVVTARRAGSYRAPDSDREERAAIRDALEQAGGVRAEAARLLGMSRTTLWRRMTEYGLD